MNKHAARWGYLVVGVGAMLFAGVLYAWSILKAPLGAEFGWGASALALNFTLAMGFFCVGGLLGAKISGKAGHRAALLLAGVLAAAGFGLTALLDGSTVLWLYVTYGALAGTGIGVGYNVIIGTVSGWFPDKKGLCSGCLMMGFGASALVLGNGADAMFRSALGWRGTFAVVGGAICLVLWLAGLLLKKPAGAKVACDAQAGCTPGQMLRKPAFWMAFCAISFLAAVGSSVISFAKDLALSVQAPEALAVSLVGVLSVCNGLGRILTGALFDALGRRRTMLLANVFTMCAAAVTLLAVGAGSLGLCIGGLCLTGLSYGACPTITAAFTSSFFGMRHFSSNMAIMTFTVLGGSLIATVSNKILEITGGYTAAFGMLLALTAVALALNLLIKQPE